MKPSTPRFLPPRLAAYAILAAACALPAAGAAAPVIGEPAPAFTLTDSQGNSRSLADYAGRTVVLEWTNHECPYVRKHYNSGNLPGQQRMATEQGVAWLVINSSAPGKQGHVDAAQANRIQADWNSTATAYLFDGDGSIGRAYAAKTTPNMYVIDALGNLRYAGAIDSVPSARPDDLKKATQYVPVVLAELAAGQPVGTTVTQPYGCSIKY